MRRWEAGKTVMAVLLIVMAAAVGSYAGKMEREANAQADQIRSGEEEMFREEDFVVLIDAGHGAVDSGKVGENGALEKDINLAIANRLYEYLCQSDMKAVRTRPEDDSLYDASAVNKKMADMKIRCQMAQEYQADIAVSIHQNSFSDASVCGPQLFYYAGSAEGEKLAVCLQESFDGVVGAENNTRVPKSNTEYYLLIHMPCPVVIAECGFLSNPQEAELLQQEDYQDRIAWNLFCGILRYRNENE